jgi:two-component system chemotaxis response regulator CheB
VAAFDQARFPPIIDPVHNIKKRFVNFNKWDEGLLASDRLIAPGLSAAKSQPALYGKFDALRSEARRRIQLQIKRELLRTRCSILVFDRQVCARLTMERGQKPWVIAIGASGAQGLTDIQELLRALPEALSAIVMVVLHRLWDHPTQLQAVLNRASTLPVIIASQGERFEIGKVYIGEPSEHLTLAADSFGVLVSDPDRQHVNRTVDLLFKSVAGYAGARMIGVVLSGSLDDGSRGLAAIHDVGGLTMVLTPSLAQQQGMPENAIHYDGPVDLIGNPQQIARAIREACMNS